MSTRAKYQDATLNRPEGDRVIDAPYVFTDLGKYIGQLKREDAWAKNDRNGITLYKTTGLTVVLTCLHRGASTEENTVNALLSVQVLDGSIEFTTDERTMVLQKDQMVTLHQDVLHSMRAVSDAVVLMITAETIASTDNIL